jgi:beta-galactosidase
MRQFLIIFLALSASVAAAQRVSDFGDGWRFNKGDSLAAGEPVTIPHTWNAVDMQVAKNDYYAGPAWYAKTFTPTAEMADKRVFLRFEGVGSVADIYVNDKLAGRHEGGYSAFAVELTPLLRFGQANAITVRADNTPRPDIVPINNTLFPVYGGIYRPVALVVTEKVNIAVTDYAGPGVYISQRNVSAKSADIEVRTKIDNTSGKARKITVETAIYNAAGREMAHVEMPCNLPPQGRQTVSQNLKLKKPHLWQGLEDPYMHCVVVRLVADGRVLDEVAQPLGVRHIELRAADGMYLNGKKVPMYGTCRHQDRWGYGSALTNEQHAEDLAIIKEMGATTIRLAHYQQAEYIYAKCDSIGFLVWAEIPFVNRVSTHEAGNARQQLTELIRQNFNHPSIYVWGLHNEVYSPEPYTAALTVELNDLAKTEDPGRLTGSVNGYGRVDHPVNLKADIQGINRYFGWYEGKIQDVEKWVEGMEKNFSGYMVMLAEYGAEANIDQQEEVVGDRGRFFSQFYPETFATKYHEIHWATIGKHPYLVASYIWNTFEFATPATTQGGVEARNMKGLVTFDRKVKKDPFYWYKANWSREPVLYITQRRATERSNKVTPVTVYSNVGQPVLTVGGREYTPVQGLTAVHWIFENVELREGPNTLVARCGNHEDTIHWNYSPDNKPIQQVEGNLAKEHVVL